MRLLAAFLLTFSVYAVEPAKPNPLTNFLPITIIVFIIYFLLIRPQKKQLEEEKQMVGALKKGDEIYTKSGLLGTIVGMTDKIITLEVSENTKLKVLRGQVGGLSSKLFEKKNDKATVAK